MFKICKLIKIFLLNHKNIFNITILLYFFGFEIEIQTPVLYETVAYFSELLPPAINAKCKRREQSINTTLYFPVEFIYLKLAV